MQTSDTRRALRVRSNLLTGRWGGLLGDTGAKKWSADVVGVFNARADTGRHTSTQQNTRSAQRCTQPSCRKPFLCVYTYSWFIKLLIYSTNVFGVQVNWFWKPTDWMWTFFHCATSCWICSRGSYIRLNTQINIQVKTFLQSLMSTGVTLINVQTLIFFLNFFGKLKIRWVHQLFCFFASLISPNKVSCEANGLQLAQVNDREPQICLHKC